MEIMKLTPLDIRKQEFRKSLRGFDPIEVQTFLDMVGEEYEQLLEDNKKLNNRIIELETKLKDFQETEKNLRETLLNVQEVKKQSEESSRRQADLLIKEAELKSMEIIEIARKQARQMRDEVNTLRTQKESFINRLRQLLISQIELLTILEIDDAVPQEAYQFLDNVKSRKKIALSDKSEVSNVDKENRDGIQHNINKEEEITDVEAIDVKKGDNSQPDDDKQKIKNKNSEKKADQINEFFKKEIQIDDLIKNLDKKKQK
jgi:cell division initiation protein